MSKNIAYVNNKFVNFLHATIHIEDRGLQFGDSVYEVIAFMNDNNFIDLDFHLERLKYSLKELDIKFKYKKKELITIFKKIIHSNKFINGIIYMQITRGVQNRSHAYKKNLKPTVIIYAKKTAFNTQKKIKGVNVITYEDYRWYRRDIKTTNLLPNILAEHEAHKKNAYTAILLKKNKITEGCHSNIWIIKNKKIYTHPSNTDILKGVTKKRLIYIIEEFGLELIEKSFTLKKLLNSDEVFLTSASSFVTPIIKVDSKLINKGKIGNITLRLSQLYYRSFRK